MIVRKVKPSLVQEIIVSMNIQLTNPEISLFALSNRLYGDVMQLEQYAEECLEAALAVRKYIRALRHGSTDEIVQRHKELIDEIADTTIMSAQARYILDESAVDIAIDEKTSRQIDRVQTEQAKRFSEPYILNA